MNGEYNLLICVLWLSCLVQNDLAQEIHHGGVCWRCSSGMSTDQCRNKNIRYHTGLSIEQNLCANIMDDKALTRSLCNEFPKGPKFFCEQDGTFDEFICTIRCPVKIKKQPVVSIDYSSASSHTNSVILMLSSAIVTYYYIG